MVTECLGAEALEEIEEISVAAMHKALIEKGGPEYTQKHAEWVVAHYSMELEKKMSPETQNKVEWCGCLV